MLPIIATRDADGGEERPRNSERPTDDVLIRSPTCDINATWHRPGESPASTASDRYPPS